MTTALSASSVGRRSFRSQNAILIAGLIAWGMRLGPTLAWYTSSMPSRMTAVRSDALEGHLRYRNCRGVE